MDTQTGEIFEPEKTMATDKYDRMMEAKRRGELVQVSEDVARTMRLGQLAKDRKAKSRSAKRKAAGAARRGNRRS